MPLWELIPNKWWLLGISLTALLGSLLWFGHKEYKAGEAKAAQIQEHAQIKLDKKVKKDYAIIDKATPSGSKLDKSSAAKFLLDHTASGQ